MIRVEKNDNSKNNNNNHNHNNDNERHQNSKHRCLPCTLPASHGKMDNQKGKREKERIKVEERWKVQQKADPRLPLPKAMSACLKNLLKKSEEKKKEKKKEKEKVPKLLVKLDNGRAEKFKT